MHVQHQGGDRDCFGATNEFYVRISNNIKKEYEISMMKGHTFIRRVQIKQKN